MDRSALLALLLFASSALAQQTGETVIVAEPVEDLYAAGRTVELRARVGGDAVVAGQWVTVSAPVAQDLIAVGERVHVRAPLGDDLRAAGREVRVEAPVAGHMVAAGESVELAAGAAVGRFAWLAGSEVRIDGDIGGELRVAAERLRIGGRVARNVEVMADSLELLPGARIEGDLYWRGGEPRIAEGAQVQGRIIARPGPAAEEEGPLAALWVALVLVIAFLIAGAILYLLFPGVAARSAEAIRSAPGRSVLVGLGVLLLTPLVIIGLFATTIGILLALILLALYLALLPLGALTGAYAIGTLGLRWSGRADPGHGLRVAALFLALLLLALIQLVPMLGSLIGFLVTLGGLGALAVLAWRGRSEGAPAA